RRELAERLIAARLRDVVASESQVNERTDDVADTALSSAQERMWFLHEMNPDSAAYTIATAYRLQGELRFDALVSALEVLVDRHEMLRSSFPIIDGRPSLVVREFV